MNEEAQIEMATFGAGCFWGVQETLGNLEGVVETAAGYMGGTTENPTYEEVCSDETGHAEVVQVKFDPATISYEKVLDAFWELHDPTQLNRQGPDVGSQYRSVIFYHTPEQQATAEASREKLEASGKHDEPIVTAIEAAGKFTKAEEYHQHYLAKRGLGTCHV